MAFLCSFGLCTSLSPSSSSSSYHRLTADNPPSPPPPPSTVPVVLAGSLQTYLLHRSVLDHRIFRDLLHSCRNFRHLPPNHRKNRPRLPLRHGHGHRPHDLKLDQQKAIFLNCDAILFEFFVWLVENDDPSLPELDLEELLEFYGGSDQS